MELWSGGIISQRTSNLTAEFSLWVKKTGDLMLLIEYMSSCNPWIDFLLHLPLYHWNLQ